MSDIEEQDDQVTSLEAAEDTEAEDTSSQEEPEEKMISQKEVDRIVQKRLKRQEDQFAKRICELEGYKDDADKYRQLRDEKSTDAERWDRERAEFLKAIQEKDEKLNTLERASIISDLATDKGLPKSFWKRVSGSSAEEIEEDIDQMISDLGITKDSKETTPKRTVKKTVYGGGGENESPDPDIDSIVSKIPRGPQFRVEKTRTSK